MLRTAHVIDKSSGDPGEGPLQEQVQPMGSWLTRLPSPTAQGANRQGLDLTQWPVSSARTPGQPPPARPSAKALICQSPDGFGQQNSDPRDGHVWIPRPVTLVAYVMKGSQQLTLGGFSWLRGWAQCKHQGLGHGGRR